MWIMLIKKLPTKPSPPKMSIHWSVKWVESTYGFAEKQREFLEYLATTREYWGEGEHQSDKEWVESWLSMPTVPSPGWGSEPNWSLARKIHYKGSDIRVFPHEFSPVIPSTMKLYTFGDSQQPPSHELVPGDTAAERALINEVRTGMRKVLFEAALLDGCTRQQALCVATGVDITIPDVDFPPIGWYRCDPEIAEFFCKPYEMEE